MATAAIVAAVGSTITTVAATQAQAKAQKKAARFNRRNAALNQARAARQTIEESRRQRAALIQAGVGLGTRGNSAISGAVGSLATQTAANIGASNTNLAAGLGINRALIQGERQASRLNNIGQGFDLLGSVAGVKMGIDRQNVLNQFLQTDNIPFFLQKPSF